MYMFDFMELNTCSKKSLFLFWNDYFCNITYYIANRHKLYWSNIILIIFTYYKKAIENLINDKVHALVALHVMFRGINVEDVGNIIINISIYTKTYYLIFIDIEQ